MSEATAELTDAEAEALNAQLPPDGDEPEPEPAPEPDEPSEPEGDEQKRQAKAQSERDMEKALASLDREAERHFNRIGEIMGEDRDGLVPCELCLPRIPGY